MLKLNFQHVQYFLIVARTLNFTQAAQELFITQPSLSKQIRQLEESLDIRLFNRNTKSVQLTPGGQLLYHHMQQMIQQLDEVIDQARVQNLCCKHTIKLGILEMGGVIEYVMPLLETYAQISPGLNLQYEVYSFNRLKQKLRDKELDVIFSFSSEVPMQQGYVTETLRDLELNVIISRKNPLSRCKDVSVADLKNEEFYLLSDSFSDCAGEYILRHCRAEGFTPRKTQSYPNLTSLFLALSQGTGVTLGYKAFFNQFQKQCCKVRFYPLKSTLQDHKVVLTYRKDKEEQLNDLLKYMRITELPVHL